MIALVFAGHASGRDYLEVGGFVLVVMALITVVRFVNERLRVSNTRNWPAATATVTMVTLREESGFQGDSSMKSWRVDVAYTYTATAQHTGSYDFSKDLRAEAESLAASLPGTEFRILLNPADEAKSIVLVQDRPD